MRLGGTAKIATAVQVKEDGFARAWRFDPLAGNSIYLRRSNAYGRGNPVWEGAKDCARKPVIAATFEAPFDAPLGNPHRQMRLNAGHDWRRGAIRSAP